MNLLKITLLAICLSASALATERIGRLGVGFNNQLKNDIPAISFKLQKSKSFAFGGMLGINSSDTGGWAAGLKGYRNIFDEPYLTFYGHFMGAIINKKTNALQDETGFQFDLGLGTEFSFQGLQSLGFSVEFGVSFHKIDEFTIETSGSNFLVGAVHFYL
jgi:hypothetical protein